MRLGPLFRLDLVVLYYGSRFRLAFNFSAGIGDVEVIFDNTHLLLGLDIQSGNLVFMRLLASRIAMLGIPLRKADQGVPDDLAVTIFFRTEKPNMS